MKISCIIVDDEAIARRGLKSYVETIDFLDLKGTCINAMQANTLIKTEQIDLLFLDIEMPLITGMDFLKSLTHPPKVIFTTAYSEYAIDSFEFDVIDYLVKPISPERFLQACNKAYSVFESIGPKASTVSGTAQKEEQDYLFVRVDKELIKNKTRRYFVHRRDAELYMHIYFIRQARCIGTLKKCAQLIAV